MEEQSTVSGAQAAVPAWVQGIYSLRFGGSEFVKSAQHCIQSSSQAAPISTAGASSGAAVANEAPAVPSEQAPPMPVPESSESALSGVNYEVDSEDDDSSDDDDWGQDDLASTLQWTPALGCAAAWIAGDAAKQMEAVSEAELHQGISTLLDSFPALARLPRKFRVMRTCWGSDPLAKGSYSYPAADMTPADYQLLARPLCVDNVHGEANARPVVLFAGEATDAVHFGTTHGACFSGCREAQRLLAHLRKNKGIALSEE